MPSPGPVSSSVSGASPYFPCLPHSTDIRADADDSTSASNSVEPELQLQAEADAQLPGTQSQPEVEAETEAGIEARPGTEPEANNIVHEAEHVAEDEPDGAAVVTEAPPDAVAVSESQPNGSTDTQGRPATTQASSGPASTPPRPLSTPGGTVSQGTSSCRMRNSTED